MRAGGKQEVFVNEEGMIRTFNGERKVVARVLTQVGTYYATSQPADNNGYIGFEGVNSTDIHDGYYPSPTDIHYHGAYAIEYL